MSQRINYIKNPSFKAGSADFWSPLGSGTVISSETDTALFGEYSLRVEKASGIFDCGAQTSGYRIPVTAGSTYTASAYIRMPEELESRTYTCKINWYDSAESGSLVSSTENSIEIFNYQVSGLGFIAIYATGVAPAGSTHAEILIYQEEREIDASAQPFRFFYIDSVMFEETAFIKGFFESITQDEETTVVNKNLKPVPYPEITGMELNADITLNGLIFNTIDEDGVLWICTDLEGWWGNSEPEVENIPRGLGDGSYDVRGRYAAREIQFSGVFFPPSKDSVSKAREKLIAAIDLVKTNGWLVVDEEPPVASVVRLVDKPSIRTVNSRGKTEFSFTLRAHDPIKYEWVDGYQDGRNTQQIQMNSSFTLVNEGNSAVPAVFEMHGPMEVGTFIRNLANQQTITLAQRLRGANETTGIVGVFRENGVANLRTNTSPNIVVGDFITVTGVDKPSFNTSSALVTSVIDDEIGENFQVGYINEGEDFVRLFITSKSFSDNVATLIVTPDAPNTIYTANTSVVVSGVGGLFNGVQVLTSVVDDTLTYSKPVSPTGIIKAFRLNNVATITTNNSLGVLVGDVISVSSQIGNNFNTASETVLAVLDSPTTNTYSISYTNNFPSFGKSQVTQKSIGVIGANVASLTVTPNYLPASVNANCLAKLDVSGDIDTSFASNIGTGVSSDSEIIQSSALQSDGKILLGGNFTTWNGNTVGRVVRLNSTGTLDDTFNINVGANSNVNAIAVQSNGQIVLGGAFTSWRGVAVDRNRIVRLNSDGLIDETFASNVNTGASSSVEAIVVQSSDQKVVVGGSFTTWDGVTVNDIVRLETNGTRDTTFTTNAGTGVDGTVSSLALQADAVTWTTQTSTFGTSTINSVAFANGLWVAGGGAGQIRTSTDAITWVTQNSTFDTSGIQSVAFGNGLWVAGGQQGQLRTSTDAITWVTRTSEFGITQINSVAFGNGLWVAGGSNGQLRTSTDAITWVTQTSTFGSTIFSLGFGNGLFVAGGFDGQLRTSTDAVTWATQTSEFSSSTINSIAFGGGLWVAGGQGGTLRTSTDAITWVTQTSTFGTSDILSVAFGGGLWVAVGVGGQLRTSVDAVTWVTRTSAFDTDWIYSVAFGNNLWVAGGQNGQIRTSADQKITIVGTFTTFNGNTVGNIVRLNPDGTRDTAFSTATGTGANGEISSVTIQPDGKIILTGSFTTWNGTAVSSIIRLNYDGSRDTTFSTNVGVGGNSAPLSVGLQSDGKIILGGPLTTWSGSSVSGILRLNSDGTRDTSFVVTGTGIGGTVGVESSIRSEIILASDDIIIAGRFRTGPSFFVSTEILVSGVDATFNGIYPLLAPTTNSASNIVTYAKTGSLSPTPVTSTTALVEYPAPAGSVVALFGTTSVDSENSFVEYATLENPLEGNPLVGLVDGDILEIDTYSQEVALNGNVFGKRFYLETLADWITLNKGNNSIQLSYLENPIIEKSITDDVATIETFQEHNFRVGDSVKIQGVDELFDGIFSITLVNSPTSFSFSLANEDIAATVVSSTTAVVANVDAHIVAYYRSGWLG